MKEFIEKTLLLFFIAFVVCFVSVQYHEQSHIRVAEENDCSYTRSAFNRVDINCDDSGYSIVDINNSNLQMEALFYNVTIPILLMLFFILAVLLFK